jgi:hypothetical protein
MRRPQIKRAGVRLAMLIEAAAAPRIWSTSHPRALSFAHLSYWTAPTPEIAANLYRSC